MTFLLRGDTFLRREDHDISSRFTAAYSRRFDVRTNTNLIEVRRDGNEVVIKLVDREGNRSEVRGDELLVATGRRPNTDRLDVAAGGIEIDSRGFVITDEQLRTNVDGVWALGDITNPVQLKHVANHEARVVRHNLLDPTEPAVVDHRFIPHAVFGYPQVAGVGLTEQECREQQIPYISYVHPYAATAYGWAMEDTDSVAKGDRQCRDPPSHRGSYHRPAGPYPHPATHPGYALRPDRRPDGPRPVLHPSCPSRGSRTGPPRTLIKA